MKIVSTSEIYNGPEKYNEWFHATTVVNWLQTVQNASPRPLVHVGTRYAAVDRAAHFSATGPRLRQNYELYRVHIAHDATFHPYVVRDLDEWDEVVQEGEPQVFAYRNEYEHSGSVSLLVDPCVLSLSRVQILPKGMHVQRRIL